MNVPNQNPYSAVNQTSPQTPKKEKSWLPTCLLGCLGLFVFTIIVAMIAGYYLYQNFRNVSGDLARTVVDSVIDSAELPDEEKQKLKTQVNRVIQAYQDEKISFEETAQILEQLGESDIPIYIMLFAADTLYIQPSGLSDEEKQAAKRIVQRVGRGLKDGTIDKSDFTTLQGMLTEKKGENQSGLKDKLTDEELREVIAECKRLVDEAEVPDEPYEINLSEEIERVIDEALPADAAVSDDAVPAESLPNE